MEQSANLLLDDGLGARAAIAATGRDEAPRITEAEQQLIASWNATGRELPTSATVPELVALRARQRPQALALTMGDLSLTYDALNRRANQLAHLLRARGVGPEELVAVCLERSLDLVVALLAVHKAGGAYLPLDPRYPRERLAYTIADADPRLLVTTGALRGLFAPGLPDVCLERDAALVAEQSAADPAGAASLDDLAYVIYTSGSTGQPKGVEITHRSLLNLVCWHQRAFAIVPADRATQLASPAFDATVWEVWPHLAAGASVHLADEATRGDPLALRVWLCARGITVTFLPTPLAERALSLPWPASGALRLMLTGADTLHVYPPANLPFTLVNNYGPTEATVVATSTPVPPASSADVAGAATKPPIGGPIDNVQVYLLDEALRLVPPGMLGELYIGGAGLARGYRGRPDLTAERFIPHPFATTAHARLYRTGDVARYRPDGQLDFLGRADEQVKIRGYRIEPSEIVAALDRVGSIQASCVIARDDADGRTQLVAYVVPGPGEHLALAALRQALAVYLPEHMIPAVFVQLDAFPVTPNGKIDRAALPRPDDTNLVPNEVSAVPTTALQLRLTDTVASTLGLQPTQVGLDDNFFLLGGHSMLGTQVIALVSRDFGVDLSLRTLFDAPTVRELAEQVELQLVAKIEAMSDDEVERQLR